MKELKLKALIKEENRIGDVVEINFSKGECIVGFGDPDEDNPEGWGGYASQGYMLSEVELLEWTGIKDKNGVDIFEGDVYDCWSQGVHKIGIVTWGIAGFYIKVSPPQCIWHFSGGYEPGEVIGNLVDNPEMLKP